MQEHQTYEKERGSFKQFKERYDSRKSVVDLRKESVELYQKRLNDEEDKLKEDRASRAELKQQKKHLELQQKQFVELSAHDRVRLKQISQTMELAAKKGGINFVKGQELAQVLNKAQVSKKKTSVRPVLTQVSDGIVVPSDAVSGDEHQGRRRESGEHASLQEQIAKLRAKSRKLSQ